MLCLLLLLIGFIELQTEDNSHRLRMQITIPEKIRSLSSEGVESHVSYNIVIEGKTYTVNLMQKAFLPHNFRVYGYKGAGSRKPFEQQFQSFCFYQGYIEGYPNSMVILSTCTGLRGILQFENVSYGIEPLEPSIGFEHVIYQVKHKNEGASLYAEEDIEPKEMSYKIQTIEHPRTISLESLAIIIAQLLSLSMGITYDDINKCQCPSSVCIMNPEAIHSSGVKIFSNCSMEDFAHFISKPQSQCLQNQPRLDPSYKAAVCGNGKVEQGEQCDCGTQEQCDTQQNKCCEAASCTLKAGYNCDNGECCENCHYKAKGQECRVSLDECDLPEYCNGSSASCQDDFFIHNGYPCRMNQWLCLDGICVSGTKQCTDTFGEGARIAPPECFQYLNSMTDQSGNCGLDSSGYKKCNPNGHVCISLEYSHNHIDNEKMWVKDGTICGQNKVCKNKECVDNYITYDCDSQKCNNQGVCNNKKNCHCNPTFLPPDCKTEDTSWLGGSVDSGNFPPASARNPERLYIENAYYPKSTRWPVFLLIPFFVVLCVMIAILVKVYFQRKKRKTEEYTSNEQLESENELKE
ncbi:ADAM metallopeptidase domain 2 [Rhinolophus ferrumequinum]|uniref:Disintegrin and metalloproteinase domain-containing protein 2 n=1 Tax=Rhinolophus ferrumequinum TaxID=59479 RepID=A0A7J7ZP01_RHIFE|nr:ADAM metallopeptidase domain 2 [Rhinolophus ferrumequinum]